MSEWIEAKVENSDGTTSRIKFRRKSVDRIREQSDGKGSYITFTQGPGAVVVYPSYEELIAWWIPQEVA